MEYLVQVSVPGRTYTTVISVYSAGGLTESATVELC